METSPICMIFLFEKKKIKNSKLILKSVGNMVYCAFVKAYKSSKQSTSDFNLQLVDQVVGVFIKTSHHTTILFLI